MGARVTMGGAPRSYEALPERGWWKLRLDGEETRRSARRDKFEPAIEPAGTGAPPRRGDTSCTSSAPAARGPRTRRPRRRSVGERLPAAADEAEAPAPKNNHRPPKAQEAGGPPEEVAEAAEEAEAPAPKKRGRKKAPAAPEEGGRGGAASQEARPAAQGRQGGRAGEEAGGGQGARGRGARAGCARPAAASRRSSSGARARSSWNSTATRRTTRAARASGSRSGRTRRRRWTRQAPAEEAEAPAPAPKKGGKPAAAAEQPGSPRRRRSAAGSRAAAAAEEEAAAAAPRPRREPAAPPKTRPGAQGRRRARAPAPAPKKPAAKKRKAAEPPEAPAPKKPATKAKQRKAEPETTMKPPDDSVRIVFTNYEPSISERGILKLLGFSEVGARDATHVITKAPLKRTPKLMIGLSTASYVVTGEWLGACLASDGRADEKPFMVKDRAKENSSGASISRGRCLKIPPSKYCQVMRWHWHQVRRDASMMLPSDSELQDIVECVGGRGCLPFLEGCLRTRPNGVLVIGCKLVAEGVRQDRDAVHRRSVEARCGCLSSRASSSA